LGEFFRRFWVFSIYFFRYQWNLIFSIKEIYFYCFRYLYKHYVLLVYFVAKFSDSFFELVNFNLLFYIFLLLIMEQGNFTIFLLLNLLFIWTPKQLFWVKVLYIYIHQMSSKVCMLLQYIFSMILAFQDCFIEFFYWFF